MTRRSGSLARAAAGLAAPLLLVVGLGACSSGGSEASVPPFGTDGVVDVAGSIAAAPSTVATGIAIDRLAMVGDSITVGSTDELQASLTGLGLDDVDIDAQSGRRMVVDGGITSGLDGVQQVLDTGAAPDLWVIALGTNDVANYQPDEYADVISQLLTALPADAPVVWVDAYLANYPDESATFDDVLRQVLAERGNASVVDWASIAAEDGVLTDGVHPSGFGKDEFAERVASAVDDWMA
jgi:lysophospholipase L1-like esterase